MTSDHHLSPTPQMPSGVHNMRWVGEFAPRARPRVKPRTLWRSSALLRDHGDLAATLAEFGIVHVVDLREKGERSSSPTAHPGNLKWHWVPIFDGTLAQLHWDTFEELYLSMVEDHGDRVAEAVGAVADGLPDPVLVHCTAGKDRTGLVCALIEDVIGVERARIFADYERSSALLGSDYLADLARLAGVDELPGERAHRSTAAPQEALHTALAFVDARGGSAEYLRSNGLTQDQLDRLQLLVDDQEGQ